MTKNTKRLEQIRSQFISYKKTLCCKQCGIKDYRLLEFHHLGAKDRNVARLVSLGYKWERIQQEIEKCIPLCANCHRLEHCNTQ